MVLIYNSINNFIKFFLRPVYSGLFLYLAIPPNCIIASIYKPNISSIEIIGLEKTENYIVEREILHPLNALIDSSLADQDRNRIFNLGLFDNVAWRIVPIDNDSTVLQYVMIESINKTPPLIFPSYEEERGWSLSGLLIINNFQGKNRTFKIEGSFGGQERIEFFLNDPWIFGNHISLSTYLEINSYNHLFLDRNINVKEFKISIGKWYGQRLKLKFSPAISKKFFMNSIDTLSYDYFIPGLNFEIDTRNIYWNPQKGLRIIQSINPMVGKNKFFVWNQSWSFYNTIAKNTTLAFNTTIQRKFGYKNNVWISYFGNSYNIRGWDLPDQMVKDNFRFGHNYLFSTLEIRRLISLMNKPKFGISKSICVVLFGDIGKISNDWTELNEKKLIGGTGLGIRIPIPVIQSLRIDIGWGFVNGEFNENCTFHFAIQQKF